VSLSNDAVIKELNKDFICGFKNIKNEPYCGKSGHHEPDEAAVVTTNGAGPHNVQMFLMTSDGVVLHCLPGYWAPQDLLYEIRFIKGLNTTWHSTLSLDEKDRRFTQAHLAFRAPIDMIQRSHLQGFDAKEERQKPDSDFKIQSAVQRPRRSKMKMADLKSTLQVIHERMAKRPFVSYEDFDVASYVEYGKLRYNKREQDREKTAVGAGSRSSSP
jgi:hypothetical protein